MDFVSREFRFKGVVLGEFSYGEKDRIVSLFTPQGLYKAIEKFGKKHNVSHFSIIEGLLVEGRGELFKLKEVKLTKTFLNIRDNYDAIEAALKMGDALLKTQLADKGAENLYLLLVGFLERLEKNPNAYLTSFLLKLLVNEGFWQMPKELSLEEEQIIEVLTLARQRNLIEEMTVDNALRSKIENLFLVLAR